MDRYASHLPVLEAFMHQWKGSAVLEFGCGDHSTQLFNDNATTVSIEQDCESFAIVARRKGWFVEWCPWKEKGMPESEPHDHYSLIFVDGCDTARKACVEWSFNHTELIIAHDSENPFYGYELITPPAGWIRLTVAGTRDCPGCAVWMKGSE